MEKLTSVKIKSSIVRQAKKIKKETGVSIGRQFEIAFLFINKPTTTTTNNGQ